MLASDCWVPWCRVETSNKQLYLLIAIIDGHDGDDDRLS
jgi:hypothetical protein